MTLFGIMGKGGYVMILIGIVLFVGIFIVVERFLYFKKARMDYDAFMKEIKAWLLDGDLGKALESARYYDTPVSRMVMSGLVHFEDGPEIASKSMESTAKREIKQLESGFGALATVVAISPMLGFFGTVTGMIKAFMKIQVLGGGVNPTQLAGGIWEALVTTAAGLGVGIIFLIFYNWFVDKVREFALEMEKAGEEMESIVKSTGEKWK